MRIAILKERGFNETRVAVSPETVKKYLSLGFSVCIEKDAGLKSQFLDEDYVKFGAEIKSTPKETLENADLILHVRSPLLDTDSASEVAFYKKNTTLLGLLDPYADINQFVDYAKSDITSFSLELIPRISRAQSMDVLSSQSNLAGYKAVLDAASEFGRAFPMMMTAAGTIPPSRVLVLGAGVAGLQAIATAKRLGAIVSAFDVRPIAKEQVESLGASFVEVEAPVESAETSGGYAKEMSDDYKKRQMQKVADVLKNTDIVICTALIPGKSAPILVTEDMVKNMKPGSVIVDLAVERGGNCVVSEAGKIVHKHHVKIMGHLNVPGRLASDASRLYARNLYHFVELLWDKEAKNLKIDLEDPIIQATLMTHQHNVIHPDFGGPNPKISTKNDESKAVEAEILQPAATNEDNTNADHDKDDKTSFEGRLSA